MSCLATDPRFRLLDRVVGWDAASIEALTGLDAIEGIRLAGDPAALSEADIDPFIPPPVLAPGCGDCDWFLATPPWPEPRLLTLDGCDNQWTATWDQGCAPTAFQEISAIAFDRHLLAVADRAARRVLVLMADGFRIIGEAALDGLVDLSFGPGATLTVACQDGTAIEVLSIHGRRLGAWPAALPAGRILRLAHDRAGQLWLVMRTPAGALALWRQVDRSGTFVAADLPGLAQAFRRTALSGSSVIGFAMQRGDALAHLATFAWDWAGRPLSAALGGNAGFAPADRYARAGQLLTLAIDSGIDHCRWHRVRIEADIPPRTAIELAVASNDSASPAPQGVIEPAWAGFAAGVPHPGDWQTIEAGALDALIQQPAGRYLFLRLRLTGDGQATPLVRRIRIDLPRATSADLLPSIYRQEPRSADFTERFLALFDAGLETIDQCIARMPAALDADAADPELLPWLGSILGIGFDPAWDLAARRRLLRAAPELYRRRGTPGGLAMALELVCGDGRPAGGAVIEEHGLQRAWGAVAGPGARANAPLARLGATRLFSRSQARLRLGTSRIGGAPVLGQGNPDEDPLETGAFRFTVTLPADAPLAAQSLVALVESQKPAHTLAHVTKGGTGGFLMTGGARLGIDTLLRQPPPSVLGSGELRLGSNTIVGGGVPPGFVLGVLGAAQSIPSSAGSNCE